MIDERAATPDGTMIDLHNHMLPGIDDGAIDLETALEMARIAVADGVHTVACTPHIYPGLYENTASGIAAAVASLQAELDRSGIPLRLLNGADVHLVPDLASGVRGGRVPTLAGSRYLLLEPPHHVAPPRFEQSVFELLVAGYVPVITHPERLTWVRDHYAVFRRLASGGAWIQLTAGSIGGDFGREAKYWSERMLDERIVHIVASDAHDPRRRPPRLAAARAIAARRIGDEAATDLVVTRPRGIVDDAEPERLPALAERSTLREPAGFWRGLKSCHDFLIGRRP
ncbi:MAG TPA: CpsB/CapC family capsule biosynthesis tyrosine phosphatase [Kofleriaceae bacterium]|nr:CpsB/CapC family capsule biosynthesis tyrosine phosphatase [Kofleriaceae bacterium]